MVRPGDELHRLADALGERATLGKPLGPLTTYGVGGPAALFVEVEGPDDLAMVRRLCRQQASSGAWSSAVFVLGRGSNLLVADEGFDGMVLHLGAGFAGVELPAPEREGEAAPASAPAVVRAGAAVALPVLARRVADAGWSGLSWAVGVPGSVGGAVRMNAGGHGSDMASCLVRYSWVDLCSEAGGTDGVAPPRLQLPLLRGGGHPGGAGGGAVRHAGRGRGGTGGGQRHRQMASRAPARRLQCRLGVHQPRGGFGRAGSSRRPG